MKQYAGVLFIVTALFALYVYNTGRAGAVLGVLRDPSYKPPLSGFGGAGGAQVATGGSKPDWLKQLTGEAATLGLMNPITAPIGVGVDVLGGGGILSGIGNAIKGLFGF